MRVVEKGLNGGGGGGGMSGLVQVNYHRISHFVETKQRHV